MPVRSFIGRSRRALLPTEEREPAITLEDDDFDGTGVSPVRRRKRALRASQAPANGTPDSSDDEDSPSQTSVTMTVWVTATATATANPSLASTGPTQLLTASMPSFTTTNIQKGLATATLTATSAQSTVIIPVAVPPPPPPKDGMGGGRGKSVSDKTEDLLIAGGSITGTIFLVILVYIYLQYRKGKTFMDIIRGPRGREKSGEDMRGPGGRTWSRPSTWVKPTYQFDPRDLPKPGVPSRSRSIKGDPPFPRKPIKARPNTSSSNRPLIQRGESQRSASFRESYHSHSSTPSHQMAELPASDPVVLGPIELPSPVDERRAMQTGPLAPSVVASSRVLPNVPAGQTMHSSHPSQSTGSMPPFINGSQNGDFPRHPSDYGRVQSKVTVPKVSRFSWTNSQAPQTPRDPYLARISIATSTDSIPRFRTIDSWVSQQAGRMAERSIKDYFMEADERSIADSEPAYRQNTMSENIHEENEKVDMREKEPSIPAVPEVPPHIKQERKISKMTENSTATVFRQHPGTEIVIPRGSRVPSEVLDKFAGRPERGMI